MPVIARYAIATLVPAFFLLLAAVLWGGFAWVALLWLTIGAALADQFLAPPQAPEEDDLMDEWADRLSLALGGVHFLVLAVAIAALSSGSGFTLLQGLAFFFATASFFGQVSHPNAHELIHRRDWTPFALGAAVYASVGFGHHVSAHRRIHHANVGTEDDPNTPLQNESYWDYMPRAWIEGFEAAMQVENERLERKDKGPWHPSNPFFVWVGGMVLGLIAAVLLGGFIGPFLLIMFWLLTGAQILMSDYVQHYGLQRLLQSDGRVEPVGPHHSWNAPRGFSSYLMMNAPSHSEHHMRPDLRFDELDPTAPVPTLPYPMPIMAMIAMVPSQWRRVMNKRAVSVMEAAQAALEEKEARNAEQSEAVTVAPVAEPQTPQEAPEHYTTSPQDQPPMGLDDEQRFDATPKPIERKFTIRKPAPQPDEIKATPKSATPKPPQPSSGFDEGTVLEQLRAAARSVDAL